MVLLGLTVLAPVSVEAAGETYHGQAAMIVGTPGTLRLVGTEGPDVVVTNGSTIVESLGGDDVICVTGSAIANVFAGEGDDLGPELAQFASWAFTRRAKESGVVASMGSIGDCYDNSMIESFWSRMQGDLLDRQRWRTSIELANAIFDYLQIWHNRQRRHSALGTLSPAQFETPAPSIVA